jgi:hypothetical protein
MKAAYLLVLFGTVSLASTFNFNNQFDHQNAKKYLQGHFDIYEAAMKRGLQLSDPDLLKQILRGRARNHLLGGAVGIAALATAGVGVGLAAQNTADIKKMRRAIAAAPASAAPIITSPSSTPTAASPASNANIRAPPHNP